MRAHRAAPEGACNQEAIRLQLGGRGHTELLPKEHAKELAPACRRGVTMRRERGRWHGCRARVSRLPTAADTLGTTGGGRRRAVREPRRLTPTAEPYRRYHSIKHVASHV